MHNSAVILIIPSASYRTSAFINAIEKINVDLKQADYRGSFEADDEVGIIFEEIKNIIKQLDRFRGEEQ